MASRIIRMIINILIHTANTIADDHISSGDNATENLRILTICIRCYELNDRNVGIFPHHLNLHDNPITHMIPRAVLDDQGLITTKQLNLDYIIARGGVRPNWPPDVDKQRSKYHGTHPHFRTTHDTFLGTHHDPPPCTTQVLTELRKNEIDSIN